MTTDGPSCGVPHPYDRIVLAHGGGGRVALRLIEDLFLRAFDDPELRRAHDGAVVETSGRIAITTDAFTITPLLFRGGDIGSLSVYGTVNDVAMCGARPAYMTASFILEEGLELSVLRPLVASMARAARECGVRIVAGDTKVVPRGQADRIFITTTGVGSVVSPRPIGPASAEVGDAVLVSGPVGDHGAAVMIDRANLDIDVEIRSDAGSVAPWVMSLFDAGVRVRVLRDPTRGGLASVVAEIARTRGLGIRLREEAIPVRPEVADLCEFLGLDPLYLASEGRFVAIVDPSDATAAVECLRAGGCSEAAVIGQVVADPPGQVTLVGPTGGARMLDILATEQLPRIC